MARPKYFVKVGQRIGRGAVLEAEIRIPYRVGRGQTARAARLICDCGTEYVARIATLIGKQPQVQSCGCLAKQVHSVTVAKAHESTRGRQAHNFIDRTGRRYGRLVVIRQAPTEIFYGQHRVNWVCQCDCGTETVVRAGNLASGKVRSCGCLGSGLRLPPGRSARNQLLKRYRQSARKRDLSWELADDDFDRLTSGDCFYCGAPPSAVAACGAASEYLYNGIDRRDNSIGYTALNSFSACWRCNNAKKDMPFEDFMAWIARLTEYHWFHPDLMSSAMLRAAGQKPALTVVRDEPA